MGRKEPKSQGMRLYVPSTFTFIKVGKSLCYTWPCNPPKQIQEEFLDVFAIEVLLSLDQFCSVCPHANVLYYDEGALIQHHIQEINISNVTAVVQPPSLVLQWDGSTCTLQRMSVIWYVINSVTL